MSIDANEFKNALKQWASGVTVVTAQSQEQEPKGMTATSFSSVSLDPPLILVCLNQSAETGALVLEQQAFAVNILSSDQIAISNQFAGGSSQTQRFADIEWQTGDNGSPIISEALVKLECSVVQQVAAGSHWVVIGEVQKAIIRSGEPVLYFDGAYRQLAKL